MGGRARHTNAGPLWAGASWLLHHPKVVRLAGCLRGGAALLTVDHCTSPPFVPGDDRPTPCRDARGGAFLVHRRPPWAMPQDQAGSLRTSPIPTCQGPVSDTADGLVDGLGGSSSIPDGSGSAARISRPDPAAGPRLRACRRDGTTTSGVMPVAVDPGLVGRQPLGDGQPEAARITRQQVPLLDGALAVCRSRRPAWRGRCPGERPPGSHWPTPIRR